MSDERKMATKLNTQNNRRQNEDERANNGIGLVRPLRRRCSCGCESTGNGNSSSPADHVVGRPEAEIARSRDNTVTSRPAIEMNRQQVLQVYVLSDDAGSDVRGHVTRGAPANRSDSRGDPSVMSEGVPSFRQRCISSFPRQIVTSDSRGDPGVTLEGIPPFRQRCISNIPRHIMTSESSGDPSVTSEGVPSFDQLHRPLFTVCSPANHHRPSAILLSRDPVRNYPYVWTAASMDRKRAESSNNFRRKSTHGKSPPNIYSNRDSDVMGNPAVSTASLDRGNFHHRCFAKNWRQKVGEGSGNGGGGRKERRSMDKNGKMMLKVLDRAEFHVDKPASVCVGTTSSTPRGRTPRRCSDVGGFDGMVDRRIETGHPLVQGLQRQSTSLERDGGRIRWRPRRNFEMNNDWECSRGTKSRERKPAKELADGDMDLINSKWIKRQIHLPITRRMRLLSMTSQGHGQGQTNVSEDRLHRRISDDGRPKRLHKSDNYIL